MDRREWLNSDEESFRLSFEGEQKKIWTCLPAIVTSVDLTRQTISAQSAISGQTQDENGEITNVDMPVFEDVALCFPKAGGYIITFPVAVDDEVLIFFASRCMDSWWQNGNANNVPPEFRMHDLSDSFAILAPTSQPKVTTNMSTDSFKIMSEDGNRYFEISDTSVNIKSDMDISFDCDNDITLSAGRDIILNSQNDINLTAQHDIFSEAINRLKLKAMEIEVDAGTEVTVMSNANVTFAVQENFQVDTDTFQINANNATYNISVELDLTVGTLIDLHVPTINLNGATVVP